MPRPSTPPSTLPPLTLVTGPARSGKTAECLRRVSACPGSAVLVGPSAAQAAHLRSQLASLLGRDHPSVCSTLSGLADRVVGPDAVARRLGRSSQGLVVADLFEATCEEGSYFYRMRGLRGFHSALTACLRELKLAGVTPEDLELAAASLPPGAGGSEVSRKLADLHRIYAAYERFLADHRLHDEEDLPGMAQARLAECSDVPDLVVLDGLLRVPPMWRGFLAALASRGVELVMSLLYALDRPLLFASCERTLLGLRSAFDVREAPVSPARDPSAAPALEALETGLFRPDAPVCSEVTDGPAPALLLFDAPSPMVEAEMAARELRREHDQRGVAWSECAVVVRSIDQYQAALEVASARLGVPFCFHRERPLLSDPRLRGADRLMSVVANGWQRDDVVAFLRSPGSGADRVAVDRLRVRAERAALRQGRAGWARLAGRLREAGDPAAGSLERMLDWDSRLTAGPRRPAEHGAIVHGVLEQLFGGTPGEGGSPAVRQALRVMREVSRIAKLAGGAEAVPLAAYWRRLRAAWESASFTPEAPPGCVDVVEPYDVRQVHPRTALVLGMTERTFPRRIVEDPFLRDDERAALQAAVHRELERYRDRTDDERLLFYLAATAPSERLVIAWSRADERSDALRSFYVDEVTALFDGIPARVRTLSDVVPGQEEAVTARDALLSECARGGAGASAVMRTASLPPAHGLVDSATRAAYGALRMYSVTELEAYARCPFQHAARYGLRLRAPFAGVTPATTGTLLHTVLRRYYRKQIAQGSPVSAEAMTQGLCEELQACLAERPLDAPPHRVQMVERFLRDTLAVFAAREAYYRDRFGSRPEYVELAFGVGPGARADDDEVDEEGRDFDPASRPAPLEVADPDGAEPVRLCGAIDRVDLLDDRRIAVALDYKSGKPPEYAAIRDGRSLQIVCYLLALERIWGLVGAAGCYESPRTSGRQRVFRVNCVDQRRFCPDPGQNGHEVQLLSPAAYAEVTLAVEGAVRSAASGIAACAVRPRPGDHCTYCEYIDVCRTSRTGEHDGEPLDPAQ